MDTAIIIPNFNGLHFLPPCMEALEKQTRQSFYTVVIDNGSKDESLPWLKTWQAADPARRILIENRENLGFSGAVNQGIRWAMEHSLPYALLLNNDTAVFPDFTEKLITELQQDREEKLFAVSSRMVKLHDERIMDDAGDQLNLLGWAFQRGLDEPAADWNQEAYVFSACAGAAIYRTSALKKTGLFDLNHFAYLEDVDLSYRAQLYGYRIKYLPSAVCRHAGSGTSGSKYNAFKVRLSSRNSWYLPYKNMPTLQLILNFPFLLLGYLIKYLFFLRKGFGKEYREGLLEGLRKSRSLKRADFRRVPLSRYFYIEWLLIKNTWEYLERLRTKRKSKH